ncbi:MAG: cobalamin-dependent protein [Dehalococcoidia bacterium]|nr:cobalamin-dependent protein [Dehalococcoidia bacterium]
MSELAEALANLEEDKVKELIKKELEGSNGALSILDELRKGMDIVGTRYKKGEYFLSELIVSGEIFKESMQTIEPALKQSAPPGKMPKVVIGTVKGDIHNIGKDIVATLLKGAGFEVYDLGIDVPPQAFVDKLVETKAGVLGMSGLLTPSFDSMKATVEAVKEAGLRDKVKIIIGGGVVTKLVQTHTGADAFTDDALEGVEAIKRFTKG